MRSAQNVGQFKYSHGRFIRKIDQSGLRIDEIDWSRQSSRKTDQSGQPGRRVVIVSTQELAELLGVTVRQVQLLAKEGIAVRVEPGKFDAAKSVQNRIEQAGRKAPMATAKTALDKENTRLAKERADAQRLKNQILRSEMLPRNAVEQEWADIMRQVRIGVLACTSRIRNRLPHLTAHDGQLIDRELREALTALADDAQATGEGAANPAAAAAP